MRNNNTRIAVNFILNADSYKNDHGRMLKHGVQYMEGSIIPRKPSRHSTHVCSFGVQIVLKDYMSGIQITKEAIDIAEREITRAGYQFNRERWEYIVSEYGGKIPLTIRAVPEGTIIPVGVPQVRVFNTDPKVVWLVGYVETMLQRGVWYPSTVASNAYSLKCLIAGVMRRHTGNGDPNSVAYHVHNFGDRGAPCYEAAVLSGASHAVFFSGSDSLASNMHINDWYNSDGSYLSSVLASEHSVTCSNSDASRRNDFNMALKMLCILKEQISYVKETGNGAPVVSMVIDTYDAFRFVRDFLGTELKQMIIELGELGGKVVARPDSGNPVEMTIKIIELFMEKFGYTVNEQGYKVLPKYLGVLQGDGINEDSIREIIAVLDEKKISIENQLFGMGGGMTHPAKGRDTFSYAMKATAQFVDGAWEDLFKDPITDVGKRSLRGRQTTYRCKESGKIFAERIELQDVNPMIEDMMVDVFVNGELVNESTFDEVRERANQNI